MVKFTLFFLSLSLLIILHEFGHFITARMFRMRVNKFYLFFDFLFPLANVMKFSLFKKKIGNTEYGLGWFPFGGYVDIHGMQAEENADPNEKPAPDEFRGKKPWQRLIVLAGGISVNFILAIIIYSMLIWANGETHLPVKNAKYGLYFDSIMVARGFQNGDNITAIDNKPITNVDEAAISIILDEPQTVQVDRGGKTVSISFPRGFSESVIAAEAKGLLSEQFPFVIDSVSPGMPAMKAGLLKGDSLVAIGTDTLNYYQQYSEALSKHKNQKIQLAIVRRGQPMTLEVGVNNDGKIGVFPKGSDEYLKYETTNYNFFSCWGRGAYHTWDKLVSYVRQMRFLFTKAGASKIGGFASIGSMFPAGWDWTAFWNLTAFISVVLAFMNLLPIPALDGGYILFVLWEMITGKKVSDKFMQRALSIGMYIILALLIYANGNDILRAFRH